VLKGWFPDNQAVATVAIGKDPQFATTAGGRTVETAVKIMDPIARFDNEISTSALRGDLILVGGPCVNTLVAQLLGSNEQCSNWPHTTGIIRTVSNAFGSGQKALIVAGTSGEDTRALAAKVLKEGTADYKV